MVVYEAVGPAVALALYRAYGADELPERVGNPDTDEAVEVMEALGVIVLEPEDVAVEDAEDEVDEAPAHWPMIDGTASTPVPMATKLVPQF